MTKKKKENLEEMNERKRSLENNNQKEILEETKPKRQTGWNDREK